MPKPRKRGDMPQAEPTLADDPRPKDTVAWNRLKLMVMDEACDRAWGCALYRMHRNGLIDTEQREAGDKYWKFIDNFNRASAKDPDDEADPEKMEAFLAKMIMLKDRRREIIDILGMGRGLLNSLIIDDEWPSTPRQQLFIRAMLQQLAIFFKTGRKKTRLSVV